MSGRVALCVGISAYSGSGALQFARQDALDVARVLEQPEFSFDVYTLVDDLATRHGLLEELEFIRGLDPEVFLFFFSGHGFASEIDTYLVTVDGVPYEEGLEVGKLGRLLDQFSKGGAATIAFLDCCHAGASTPWPDAGRLLRAEDVEEAIPATPLSRVVVAACQATELSFEDPALSHGLFTHHLLEGLQGAAVDEDGRITATSIYHHIDERFRAETSQRPVFRASLAADITLADGFPPRSRTKVKEQDAIRIEEEAEQFLDAYNATRSGSFETWRTSGYASACQALEPLLRWFDNQLQMYPSLMDRRRFRDQYSAAQGRLAQLGSVDPGTVLQRGILSESLGSGAFGTVWKVESPSGGPPVAYKVYHPAELGIAEKVSRFERGWRAMRQLDHPRVVRVHEFTPCPVGFFMDYIEGPNLRTIISEITSDPTLTIRTAVSVGETLRHAHGRGVSHRDIKPENILMKYNAAAMTWEAYLTDFDLAWFSTATQMTRDAMGTMYYASPEQLAKPGSAAARDKTVDIYSFGQLLFFLLTGSDPSPFAREENLDVLARRLQDWANFAATDMLIELYREATESSPAARPGEMGVVLDRLAAVQYSLRQLEDEDLDLVAFILEIGYALGGYAPGLAFQSVPVSVTSHSGQTSMSLDVATEGRRSGGRLVGITARITPLADFGIEGQTTERARAVMNQRIDAAIEEFGSARRRHASGSPYEALVDIFDLVPNKSGIERARRVLSRVIEVVERA